LEVFENQKLLVSGETFGGRTFLHDTEVELFSPLVSSAADVHEKRGRSGNVREVRLARVGMAVLVAPFSLFRFFWARKRNENRKQWMKPTERSLGTHATKRSGKPTLISIVRKNI
jgi:hypothetical protein